MDAHWRNSDVVWLCRLGEDDGYKQYKNHFVENTLALNKYQHKEDKDRDRHASYKFSIGGPVEFEWAGSLYGSRVSVVLSTVSSFDYITCLKLS